jgi:hypothetical protein
MKERKKIKRKKYITTQLKFSVIVFVCSEGKVMTE